MRRNLAIVSDFVTVYIEEAHPAEKDNFTGNMNIVSHASLEDRMEAARTLKEEAGEDAKNEDPAEVDRDFEIDKDEEEHIFYIHHQSIPFFCNV